MNHFELPVSYKNEFAAECLKFYPLSGSGMPTSAPGEMIF